MCEEVNFQIFQATLKPLYLNSTGIRCTCADNQPEKLCIAVFQILAMQSVMCCTSMCVRSCSTIVTKTHSQDFKHAYAYNSTATEHYTGCRCSLQNCTYAHYVSASRFALQELGKPQYIEQISRKM